MLPLTVTRLSLRDQLLHEERAGVLIGAIHARLRQQPACGTVLLGAFGSGKTRFCSALASHDDPNLPPCSFVPLSLLSRAESLSAGLEKVVGRHRLDEARDGRRVLLLDGLDEVPPPRSGRYGDLFDELTTMVGPRWLLTSRPGHFRTTDSAPDPEQVDTLDRDDIATFRIDPLTRATVHEVLGRYPGGERLLHQVDGLEDLATSPLLLHIVQAAFPFIEPDRPIEAWAVFDAWLRFALSTGMGHADALEHVEDLVWKAYERGGYQPEILSFAPSALREAGIHRDLRRTLTVTDLDGHVRFGHRSVFEYFVASRMGPALAANQGRGPDELTGVRLTEATRAFLVGRTPPMPRVFDRDRILIPRGNYVSGGVDSPDERPLRIGHVAEPFWIARTPVTNDEWQVFYDASEPPASHANYLRHWQQGRAPEGRGDEPVYHLRPDDADRYAAWLGARLPTADEWEKAVRGIDGRRWPWGDFWRPGLGATAELGVDHPTPVRALGAQGHSGLFTAIGGVFEITSSRWRDRDNRGRVLMGGCFAHPFATARPSLRLSHRLSGHLKAGVRLAWDAT